MRRVILDFELRLTRVHSALRHIRLMNTQEQKPITNSRDTQELLWHAGCEVLAIFSKFREKTSLLQDWGFHEVSLDVLACAGQR